jgi:serine/threonine protein kinase
MTELDNIQLGQYKLLEAIGHGGMATVYKAYQESLDRYVAIKVLLSNRDPQFAARFKREARAIAALQHHNILPIYDYGEQDGLLYFVMQYVDTGVTLHDLLGRPIAPIEGIQLVLHVLNALQYAHMRGVIHRDIKPANVLLPSPSWALLADFGIAKLLNDSQHLTMTGFIIGTAAYMAPEQAAGKPIDARTDLYSLGVVLYEMLTGRVPFDAETPMAMLTKHVYEPPPPPRSLNPNLSPVVAAVLLRALEKNPNDRYQSASEMATDLERVVQHLSRSRPSSQVSSLYNAGVESFEQGRYVDASEQLKQVVAIDPNYEDATILLKAAQAAHARAAQPDTAANPTITPQPSDDQASQVSAQSPAPTPTAGQPPNGGLITDKLSDTTSSANVDEVQAGSAPTTKQLRCPECGQAVQAEWQACPFCRTQLKQAQPREAAARVDTAVPIASPQTTRSGPMWQRWALLAGVVLLMGGASGAWAWSRRTANMAIVPPIVAATASETPTSTATRTPTFTATQTPTPTATLTATPTDTATATASETPTLVPTATATDQPTAKPTRKPTPKPAPKPAVQPTPVPAPVVPPTAVPQPTPLPPTNTAVPPTNTPAPQHHDSPPKPKFTPRP